MFDRTGFSLRRTDTSQMPIGSRVAAWETHTRAELVGVQCTPSNGSALVGLQCSRSAGTLAVAEMRASSHVVERRPVDITELPGNAVLVCFLLEGEALLGQLGQWFTLKAGDAVAFPTDEPFVYALPQSMRQVILVLPIPLFEHALGRTLPGPRLLSGSPGFARGGPGLIAHHLLDWLGNSAGSLGVDFQSHSLDLLSDLFRSSDGGINEAGRLHYLAACAWIAEHIEESNLTPCAVARAGNLSTRQLHRLFANSEMTVAKFINERRLERARITLENPTLPAVSLGEVGYQCGFSSQSVFTRQFRSRYGITPRQCRDNARCVHNQAFSNAL